MPPKKTKFKKGKTTLKKDVAKIKKMLTKDIEKKILFPDELALPLDNLGDSIWLTNAGLGTGHDNRVGSSINVTSCHIKGTIYPSITGKPSITKFWLVVDTIDLNPTLTSGVTTPQPQLFLQDTPNYFGSRAVVNCNLNAGNLGRFRILKKFTIYNDNNNPINHFDYRINMKSLKVTFDSANQRQKNHIYLMCVSNLSSVDYANMDFNCQIYFTDM